MRRALTLAVGLLAIVAPRRLVDYGERLAFANPDAGRLRPWTIPIARLKGLAFVWLLGRESTASERVGTALAVGGLLMAVLPRTVVERNLQLAYENADDLEVKPWVVPATRLLGGLYVVAGLFARPAGGPTDIVAEADHRDRRA